MAVAASTARSPAALRGLGHLAPWRQIALLVALAGSIALGVAVALWSQAPNYALLYGSLSGKDAADILEALGRAGIPFRVEQDSGAITVPASRVHEARIKLAEDGLPKGTATGFAILDQSPSFGTSEFIERARYTHALEIELARTISALNPVRSARVHLAVPRQSAFLRHQRAPSASVLVNLEPGRRLEAGQPEAIAHLVAAAVPNLEASRVRVVDDRGRLLTRPDGGGPDAPSDAEIDYEHRVEDRYIRRIEDILAPVVGVDGVRAQVVAEIDFSSTDQAREMYNPDLPALRSEQVIEETHPGGTDSSGGVPGALSNQPPGVATAPETTGATGAPGTAGAKGAASASTSASSGSQRRESTRNYELDRTVSHMRKPSGMVRRLSAAVVVDNARVPGGADGATRPRTPEEIARITSLVKDAIGFDAERGDTVNVINAPFTTPAPAKPLPPLPLWKQPWVWDAARQVGGGLLVLLLAFGVLRPVMRTLVSRDIAERELEQAAERARIAAQEEEESHDVARARAKALPDHSGEVDVVRAIAAEDPRRVANVVREWVSDHE